jgi:hypothetical protein
MQGAAIRDGIYDRCLARTLAPGSPVLADHPKTVNLREDLLLPKLNAWLGELFARENRNATVAAMLASQEGDGVDHHEPARKRLADAEARLRKHTQAIEAGVDPTALLRLWRTFGGGCYPRRMRWRRRPAHRSGHRCRHRSSRWRSHDLCAERSDRSPAAAAPPDPAAGMPSRTRTAASRPTAIPRAGSKRGEALPASSRTTLRTCSPSRTVRRWYRSIKPGTCSRKVRRAHSVTEQRIRRIRNLTSTRRPSIGTSAGTRS